MPTFTKEEIEAGGLDKNELRLFNKMTEKNDPEGTGRRFILERPDKDLMLFLEAELKAGHKKGAKDVIEAVMTILGMVGLGLDLAEDNAVEIDPTKGEDA